MITTRRVILAGLLSGCAKGAPPTVQPTVLEIRANEYAFQAPDTVDPGTTTIRLRNDGRVLHEMIVMQLRPGVVVDSLVAAHRAEAPMRPFLDGGSAVLFAPPERTGSGELQVTLEAGRDYVLWCNFRDAEGAPQHATLGMFKRIHVRESSGEPEDVRRPGIVVEAVDYAFRAPDTIDAGPVELRIRNAGAQRHELSLSRLRQGVPASEFMRRYLRGDNVDSLYDDDGAILTAYPGDDNRTAILADLRRGHEYVLVCEFRDTPQSPSHTKLGMFKGIVVR